MGRVYRATDKKVGEEVAIKLLNPSIAADKKTLERFRNELKFARKIAADPNFLMELEWRELEKMVAFVLEELGFAVILTPGAKDGGKDIIAELKVDGHLKVFYIEVKH